MSSFELNLSTSHVLLSAHVHRKRSVSLHGKGWGFVRHGTAGILDGRRSTERFSHRNVSLPQFVTSKVSTGMRKHHLSVPNFLCFSCYSIHMSILTYHTLVCLPGLVSRSRSSRKCTCRSVGQNRRQLPDRTQRRYRSRRHHRRRRLYQKNYAFKGIHGIIPV